MVRASSDQIDIGHQFSLIAAVFTWVRYANTIISLVNGSVALGLSDDRATGLLLLFDDFADAFIKVSFPRTVVKDMADLHGAPNLGICISGPAAADRVSVYLHIFNLKL